MYSNFVVIRWISVILLNVSGISPSVHSSLMVFRIHILYGKRFLSFAISSCTPAQIKSKFILNIFVQIVKYTLLVYNSGQYSLYTCNDRVLTVLQNCMYFRRFQNCLKPFLESFRKGDLDCV